MPRVPSFTLGLVLASATLLSAQQPSHSFVLNVTATDAQGKPVADLSSGDFQVLDNGKPRPVASVDVQAAADPAAVVIVLDLFNAGLSERNLAAKSLADALEKNNGTENVFLYLITPAGTPFAVHGVLEKSAAGLWTKQARAVLDAAMNKVNGLKNGVQQMPVNRVAPTWNSMFQIAEEMERINGPKYLVWITQGVQDGFVTNQELHMALGPLQAFSARLNRMRAVAYSIQSRPSQGLESESPGSEGDALNQISALTGGKVYRSDATDELLGMLLKRPPALNYRITLSTNSLDGKYHKLRIATTRPGVSVTGTERYYSTEPPRIVTSTGGIPRD